MTFINSTTIRTKLNMKVTSAQIDKFEHLSNIKRTRNLLSKEAAQYENIFKAMSHYKGGNSHKLERIKVTIAGKENAEMVERKKQEFNHFVNNRWGGQVRVVNSSKECSGSKAAIWESNNKPGTFGVYIPNKDKYRASSLEDARIILAKHGIDSRISNGDGIRVNGTNLPSKEIRRLESLHSVSVLPIRIGGKEIAYLFRRSDRQNEPNHKVLISAHGSAKGEQRTFEKPDNLELDFASTTNNVLVSNTMAFAEKLQQGKVVFEEESQIYDSSNSEATDYRLTGGIGTMPEDVAKFIGKIDRVNAKHRFDFVLLNREAKGVHFSDLIQALKDSCGSQSPDQLICHFCRPKDESAGKFNVKNNYRG
ncbi:hypothetical protein F0225_12925 [Vibrio pectenicida]|uniref:Putative adhesin Stv domain-containing protein n=1 Tax=Vibrio pectenicida TaxID=62763 RepID=A0A7Y4A0D2_9VIBR|nr:hypothetical protein [Vibrio pectenicida]NOH72233.1 hypothetical protein [Vibrio pectenicida]